MKTFKLCVLWDQWTPRVTNRIIIDMLALQRFFRRNRVEMFVASPPELVPALQALGIRYSSDFSTSDTCRMYVCQGREIPDALFNAVPEDCAYDVCYLDPQDNKMPALVTDDKDPYGRFHLPYPGKPIPPTMQPKYYRQKQITEPMLAPYLSVALCVGLFLSNVDWTLLA